MFDQEISLNLSNFDYNFEASHDTNHYNDDVINDDNLDIEESKKKKDIRDAIERLLEVKRLKEETDFI